MKFKRKTMRIVSGMLTAITLFTNALSPVIAYAALLTLQRHGTASTGTKRMHTLKNCKCVS